MSTVQVARTTAIVIATAIAIAIAIATSAASAIPTDFFRRQINCQHHYQILDNQHLHQINVLFWE